MVRRKNKVNIAVSRKFFENVFEPERKNLERQLGVRVGQIPFTEILAKQKITLLKRDNKFLDKELKIK